MQIPNPNYLHAAIILSELAKRGVKHVVISPGSRSTPLARTAVLMNEFDCVTILDERSAGFYALGLSKVTGHPVILICTSGTAGANYYPAVIEAKQSFVPLIVMTADRPLRLRHTGAPQTIDQDHLYGMNAKFFADVPPASLDFDSCRNVRELTAAVLSFALKTPRGPVHLNVPFDEPLAPVVDLAQECEQIWSVLQSEPAGGKSEAGAHDFPDLRNITGHVERAMCGLIVAGPHAENPEAIFKLGRRLGWPIVADVVSGLRFSADPVIPYYDIFLRKQPLPKPDLVLEFGGCPTSKVLNDYLNSSQAHTIRMQSHEIRMDPFGRASEIIVADVKAVCGEIERRLSVARDSLLLEPFSRQAGKLRTSTHTLPMCEAAFVNQAIRHLPDQTNLVLASSLPIRYADSFAVFEGKRHPVFAQRGTNGIDGTISHAAGIAAGSDMPTVLICGDLAFLHDFGGLLAAKRVKEKLTILLLNNDGGGIFSFLPIAEHQDTFEQIHGTPHGLDLSLSKDLFDLDWRVARRPDDVAAELGLNEVHAKLRVVEVKSERVSNRREHEKMMAELITISDI